MDQTAELIVLRNYHLFAGLIFSWSSSPCRSLHALTNHCDWGMRESSEGVWVKWSKEGVTTFFSNSSVLIALMKTDTKKSSITSTFLTSSVISCLVQLSTEPALSWPSSYAFVAWHLVTSLSLLRPYFLCFSFWFYMNTLLPLYFSWVVQSLSTGFPHARSERGLWWSQELYYYISSPFSTLAELKFLSSKGKHAEMEKTWVSGFMCHIS